MMSIERAKRSVLVIFLLLTYLLTSYNASIFPLRSLLGSLVIILIGRAAWPITWKDRLGLRIQFRELALAIALALPLMFIFYWFVQSITVAQNVGYLSPISRYGILNPVYLHTLGQTLNEELILGALLLTTLSRSFSRIRPLAIAALVAAGFSLLHFAFYAWIVVPENSGLLTAGTLFVLFALGLLRNTLILKTNHIAYAWCLHLSVNMVGLWGLYTATDGHELNEPEIFNLILGSPGMIILAGLIVLICALLLQFHLERIFLKFV